MLRILVRFVLLLLALVVAIGALEIVAAESGEVVVLRTRDGAGAVRETRLWVVEHEGRAWLRAGHAKAGWFRALEARPDVEVVRGARTHAFRAVPEPAARAAINARMREKYGWADRYISFLFGRDDAVPIRLEPRAPGADPSSP